MIMIECPVSGFLGKIKAFLGNYKEEDTSKELVEKAFHSAYTDIVLEFLNCSNISELSNGRFQTVVPHASYFRPLLFMNFDISVQITRVRCDDGSTHAVLLSFMIPYSSRTICDYISALTDEDPGVNAPTDHFERILLRWLFRRFLLIHPDLRSVPVTQLSSHCLKELNLQFMQFRSVPVFSLAY